MTNAEAFELAKINPELEDYVLKDMPSNFNKVQKTIYVYTKLCSILNYDPEYSSSDRAEGKKQVIHANIKNIENISLNNPDVICYDFNIIFAKFLKKFDVNFAIRGYSELSNVYGNHSDVHVIFDEKDLKGIASYGKVVFLGYSDMKQLKVDRTLLTKPNSDSDENFLLYFRQQSKNMIDLVLEQEMHEKQSKLNFEQDNQKIKALEKKFKANCPDFVEPSEADATDVFVALVQEVNMNRHDASFYIEKIFKNLIPQNSNNILTYTILKERSTKDPDIFDMISIFNIASDKQDFFLKITPPNKVYQISKEELQSNFDDGTIDYIGGMLPAKAVLPNIHSKMVDRVFERSIKGVKNAKQKTIKDIQKCIKKFEDEGCPMTLPDVRIWKYATNFAQTNENDITNKNVGLSF